MNEQAIAKLQALKTEPGILMRWQEQLDAVIADLSTPPSPPSPPPSPVVASIVEDAAPKSKVTTAAQVSSSTHKGK